LRIGDEVYDDQGQPTEVVAVSPIWRDRQLYDIRVSHAKHVNHVLLQADESHEWVGRETQKRWKPRDIYTTEQVSQLKYALAVKDHPGLQAPEVNLPVDPWLLGLWLGDGATGEGRISCGDKDRAVLRGMIEAIGYDVTTDRKYQRLRILGLPRHLKAAGVYDHKHVPDCYLRASRAQRIRLLQGLVDSDGSVDDRGRVEFSVTNTRLAQGAYELVRSLGIKTSLRPTRAKLYGRDMGLRYRIAFFFPEAAALPRKACRCRRAKSRGDYYLQAIKAGRGDTVCIQVAAESHMYLAGRAMIPTHNSELVSRCLPAYLLGREPTAEIIAASYSAGLASRLNRDVQRLIDSEAYREIFPDTLLNSTNVVAASQGTWLRNSSLFEVVEHGGIYRSAGVGGAITGMGAKYAIIDDPIKNQEEAYSATYREKVWDWFTSTLYTRLQGADAGILLTLTRWHEDDLAGRLLKLAESDPKADQWEVLSLPAVCEPDKHDDDPREPGEALWPERFPLDLLNKNKANGAYFWSALYQQRPTPQEGGIVKEAWLQTYRELPEDVTDWLMSWDLTFKETRKGSYVCGQVWCRKGACYYLVDQVRERLDFPGTVRAILAMVDKYSQCKTILVEDKANGPAVIATLKDKVPGLIPVTEKGSKEARLHAVSPLLEAGNVYLPQDAWVKDLIAELVAFPNSAYDDQVDTLSQALARYAKKRKRQTRGMSLNLNLGMKSADERPLG
jgi:predicted phage terminase large subunit-like protein